jgi:ankyrin repeat protein
VLDANERQRSLSKIKAIVRRRPRLVRYPMGDSSYPLHTAAEESLDVDVVRYVRDRWPAALTKADYKGRLPLHYAAARKKRVLVLPIVRL